ncbi:MAG: type II toxin-antitoxin system VapC family toxin [bacterium]|nr:type II toxin-antitoxin system VapC family toxin [bacterium]
MREGYLRVLPLADDHVEIAMEVMALLPEHPLRTLDALHLAIARSAGLETVATADRVMAAATAALGLAVERFGVRLEDLPD